MEMILSNIENESKAFIGYYKADAKWYATVESKYSSITKRCESEEEAIKFCYEKMSKSA